MKVLDADKGAVVDDIGSAQTRWVLPSEPVNGTGGKGTEPTSGVSTSRSTCAVLDLAAEAPALLEGWGAWLA
jgi:hypothetical protein